MESPVYSDEELARQSQAGSADAFEALVVRHQAGVYRFLLACTRCEADAHDLTQATFVAIWRAWGSYRADRAFVPWLFTIARRKFIDHRRAIRRAPEIGALPELEDGSDPATELSEREDRKAIWTEVRRTVSGEQFQALWLHYRMGFDVESIARVLGRTRTSVKVLMFRARQVLLKRLTLAWKMEGIEEAHSGMTTVGAAGLLRHGQPPRLAGGGVPGLEGVVTSNLGKGDSL